MNIISLNEQIKEYYENNEYEITLQKIDEYLNIYQGGIYNNLLNMLIVCQMKLGLFDEAYKNVQLMQNKYPYFYNKLELALKYSECRKIDKLNELLEQYKDSFSGEDYYFIARKCYYNGNHQKSKELFELCLNNSNLKDEKIRQVAEFCLRKIELKRNNNNVFEENSYSYFKSQGKKLMPGHIIYAYRIRNNAENGVVMGANPGRRPYMIWKIDGNKMYTFPIVERMKLSQGHVLYKQNYPNRVFDGAVKTNLVCIYENDVEKVIDKVSDYDYKKILENLYKITCLDSTESNKLSQMFMSSMLDNMNVQTNYIIAIHDFKINKNRLYFVLDVVDENQKYRAIEIKINDKNEFEVIGRNPQIIEKTIDNPILYTYELPPERKPELLEQIITITSAIGYIVEYNIKRLEVMTEEDDYYICIDAAHRQNLSHDDVVFIKRDVPLSIVEKIPKEEYKEHLGRLKKYIKKNSKRFDRKKRNLKKRYKS